MKTLVGMNIITSLSVVLTCLCLLTLMVFVHSKFSSKNFFVLYVIYAIIGIGTYVVLTMFQTTSVLIKNDVIDTIENTEHYIGFNDPIIILTISFIGAILGGIWYKMKKIIKKSNFKNKKRR